MITHILIFVCMVMFIFIEKDHRYLGYNEFFAGQSPYAHIGEFNLLFEFILFYIWISYSLVDIKRLARGRSIAISATTTTLIYSLMYAGLGYMAFNITVKDTSYIEYIKSTKISSFFKGYPIGLIYYLLNIFATILVFPFKFYLGKEFFFILYDEVANKSLS